MRKIEWGWVSRELAAAEANDVVKEVVASMLHTLTKERDKWDLSEDDERDVLIKIQKLAAGHSIALPKKEERWVECIPGYFGVRDTVRVKNDAYTGERGVRDNGRRGRVVAARDGFVIVVYDGESNADIQYRHRPEQLEVLR
jgi:hypothetical protein